MTPGPTIEEYVRDIKLVIEAMEFLRANGVDKLETLKMNDEQIIRTALARGWA